MRIVDLGHGIIAFEPEGSQDQVAGLDVQTLRSSGWSDLVIDAYIRHRDPTDFLRRSSQASDDTTS